jgi:hypothetical protein
MFNSALREDGKYTLPTGENFSIYSIKISGKNGFFSGLPVN